MSTTNVGEFFISVACGEEVEEARNPILHFNEFRASLARLCWAESKAQLQMHVEQFRKAVAALSDSTQDVVDPRILAYQNDDDFELKTVAVDSTMRPTKGVSLKRHPRAVYLIPKDDPSALFTAYGPEYRFTPDLPARYRQGFKAYVTAYSDIFDKHAEDANAISNYTLQGLAQGSLTPDDIRDTACPELPQYLNPEQRDAIRLIVQSASGEEQKFCPMVGVSGPPGTGKTVVVTEAVRVLMQQNRSVLVCATQNNTAEQLAERIYAAVPEESRPRVLFVRANRHVDKGRHDFELARIIKRRAALGQEPYRAVESSSTDRKIRARLLKQIRRAMAKAAQVVISTTSSISLGDDSPVDAILADEAGAEFIGSSATLLRREAKTFALIGDTKQLPPFSQQRDSPGDLHKKSLLHILGEGVQLNVQRRARAEIAADYSDFFYEGRLVTPDDLAPRRISIGKTSRIFVTVEAADEEDPKYFHMREIEAARLIRQHLTQQGVPSEEIVVLSAYKKPTNALTEGRTVDSMQGTEAEVVINIFSLRGPPNEFQTNPNRLNVAISRAKSARILVGTRNLFESDKSLLGDLFRRTPEVVTIPEFLQLPVSCGPASVDRAIGDFSEPAGVRDELIDRYLDTKKCEKIATKLSCAAKKEDVTDSTLLAGTGDGRVRIARLRAEARAAAAREQTNPWDSSSDSGDDPTYKPGGLSDGFIDDLDTSTEDELPSHGPVTAAGTRSECAEQSSGVINPGARVRGTLNADFPVPPPPAPVFETMGLPDIAGTPVVQPTLTAPGEPAEYVECGGGEMFAADTSEVTPPAVNAGAADLNERKKLSFVLRHKRNTPLSRDGWISLARLRMMIRSLREKDDKWFAEVVASDDKQRYSLRRGQIRYETFIPGEGDDDVLHICANQGHSRTEVEVEMLEARLENLTTPIIHGTTQEALAAIAESGGLSRMARQHIHFAQGLNASSGIRATSRFAIEIDMPAAQAEGFQFFVSSNGVVLCPGDDTGFLPAKFFVAIYDFHDSVDISAKTLIWDRHSGPVSPGADSVLDSLNLLPTTLPPFVASEIAPDVRAGLLGSCCGPTTQVRADFMQYHEGTVAGLQRNNTAHQLAVEQGVRLHATGVATLVLTDSLLLVDGVAPFQFTAFNNTSTRFVTQGGLALDQRYPTPASLQKTPATLRKIRNAVRAFKKNGFKRVSLHIAVMGCDLIEAAKWYPTEDEMDEHLRQMAAGAQYWASLIASSGLRVDRASLTLYTSAAFDGPRWSSHDAAEIWASLDAYLRSRPPNIPHF